MDYSALIGLLAQVGGGVAGQLAGMPNQAQAGAMLQAARDAYGNISIPKLQQLIAAQQQPSGMQGVTVDPRLRAAQLGALTQMQDLAKGGGLNLSDRAALNQVGNQLGRTQAANRASLSQGLQARGLDSSGAELALGQKDSQNQDEAANQRGLGIAGGAQNRALEAMMTAGRLGGSMEGQQFSEDSQKAQAQDAINRHNTDLQSAASMYNAGIPQQEFSDAITRAGGMSGGDVGLSNYYGNQAQQQRQFWGGLGQGVGQGINAYGAYSRGQGGGPSTSPGMQYPTYDSGGWENPYAGWGG